MKDVKDAKLEKVLRANQPEVPGAPAGELRALLGKIERSRASAKRGGVSSAWMPALAATVVMALGLSVWVYRQKGGFPDPELEAFVYRSMVVDAELAEADLDEELTVEW